MAHSFYFSSFVTIHWLKTIDWVAQHGLQQIEADWSGLEPIEADWLFVWCLWYSSNNSDKDFCSLVRCRRLKQIEAHWNRWNRIDSSCDACARATTNSDKDFCSLVRCSRLKRIGTDWSGLTLPVMPVIEQQQRWQGLWQSCVLQKIEADLSKLEQIEADWLFMWCLW